MFWLVKMFVSSLWKGDLFTVMCDFTKRQERERQLSYVHNHLNHLFLLSIFCVTKLNVSTFFIKFCLRGRCYQCIKKRTDKGKDRQGEKRTVSSKDVSLLLFLSFCLCAVTKIAL